MQTTKFGVKHYAIVIFMALLAAFIIWLFLPAPFEVETALAERGDLSVSITELGVVSARDRYLVKAPVAAQFRPANLKVGDRVSAGQLLARLSPKPLTGLEKEDLISHLRAAQARSLRAGKEVEEARAAMEAAQREELREAELLSMGAHSPEKHEAAKNHLGRTMAEARGAAFRADVASGDLRAAEHALSLAEESGRVLDMFSPVEGVVSKLFEKTERVVQAGAQILEISDSSRLEVVFGVRAADAVKINRGVSFTLGKTPEAKPLTLRVREVESAAFEALSPTGEMEQRVNVKADVPVAATGLIDGATVEARFVLQAKRNVIKVPASAVISVGGRHSVFTVTANQARQIDIVPGLRNPAETEVVSGLEEGTPVIIHPPAGLKEGSRIAPFRSRSR
ncbi:MAG: hypothetical protein RIR70_1240 [Pseudomonadota bacterium]|jgi:HlyD family secretion protein